MAEKTISNNRRKQADDFLTIKELIALCMNSWKWFVVSLIISMSIAAFYLLSTPSTFTRTISVQVKDGRNGSDANQQLEEIGIDMTSSNITDEIISIHSPAIIYEMVSRLHLEMNYFRPGLLKDQPLYAETLPVNVEMKDLNDKASVSFMLEVDKAGKVTLSKMKRGDEKLDGKMTFSLNENAKTPLGQMRVQPTLYYKKGEEVKILVKRNSINATAKEYNGCISAKLQEKNSNIIDVQCVDYSIARAEDVLNTLVSIYNENWVKNRNQIAVSTNEFIKERLGVIESELGSVDSDISNYKSAHAITDVNAVANQAMSVASETDQASMELNNQLYMARYIRNYLTNGQHNNQLLPANSGINNPYIEQQISEYNNIQLQRNNLVAHSSEQNPIAIDLEHSLNTMRKSIVNSLDNELTTLSTRQRSIQASHGQAVAKMTATPSQAKYLLSVERQQKVKESLYLFLLQKREENELSQAFTAYNTRIIASPNGSDLPTAPVRSNVVVIALAIGLLFPATIVFIKESTNTAIRGRKDIEKLTIPFIGEVPLWRHKVHWWKRKEMLQRKEVRVVVKSQSRNIVNEAFRIVRTNLEFMANSLASESGSKNAKVIMMTSFNPGSGKTFICANLGTSISIRDKKVLCLDLDLRRASLSKYAGEVEKGLADYLGGFVDSYEQLVVHKEDSGLDIIPVGSFPPNPTELLLSPRMKQMLDEAKQKYDYIFLDCPPVEIVADASIMSKEADVTIFVIRSGLMQKNMLSELENYYADQKFSNLCIILNGTDVNNQYGYNRYGYGYGRSGYGYGYGYGYGSKKED